MNIFELFTARAVAANWTEAQSNRIPYLGEAFFPADKKAGLDLAWIKGNKGLPVSLMPSAFDAKATFRDRPGMAKTETEMPFFREGYKLKEKDRQDLLRVMESSDPYAQQVIARVFNDTQDLIEGAAVVRERMRMALLFPANGNAVISFKANGVDYTYNYDPDGSWKATNYTEITTPTKKWNVATADPFEDIDAVQNTINAATGANLDLLIMNSATFNKLAKITAVKDRFLTVNGKAIGYVTPDDVRAVLSALLNVQIVVYNKQYKDESGVAHAFVPDGYVALLPAGPIGKTWFGTTPEEADLLNGDHDVSIVDKGVAILRTVHEHPVGLNVFASEIVLPSYERMNEVALLKVY